MCVCVPVLFYLAYKNIQDRDGVEHLHIQTPYTCAPMFKVLAELHSKVVHGPPSSDASIHILNLHWSADSWPAARITDCHLIADVTDVCTCIALVFMTVSGTYALQAHMPSCDRDTSFLFGMRHHCITCV